MARDFLLPRLQQHTAPLSDWFLVKITGSLTVTTPDGTVTGYTFNEIWLEADDGTYDTKGAGRLATAENPGIPITGQVFSTGQLALAKAAEGTGNLYWQLIGVGSTAFTYVSNVCINKTFVSGILTDVDIVVQYTTPTGLVCITNPSDCCPVCTEVCPITGPDTGGVPTTFYAQLTGISGADIQSYATLSGLFLDFSEFEMVNSGGTVWEGANESNFCNTNPVDNDVQTYLDLACAAPGLTPITTDGNFGVGGDFIQCGLGLGSSSTVMFDLISCTPFNADLSFTFTPSGTSGFCTVSGPLTFVYSLVTETEAATATWNLNGNYCLAVYDDSGTYSSLKLCQEAIWGPDTCCMKAIVSGFTGDCAYINGTYTLGCDNCDGNVDAWPSNAYVYSGGTPLVGITLFPNLNLGFGNISSTIAIDSGSSVTIDLTGTANPYSLTGMGTVTGPCAGQTVSVTIEPCTSPPVTSWNCTSGVCVEIEGSGGEYSTEAECEENCSSPPPPPPSGCPSSGSVSVTFSGFSGSCAYLNGTYTVPYQGPGGDGTQVFYLAGTGSIYYVEFICGPDNNDGEAILCWLEDDVVYCVNIDLLGTTSPLLMTGIGSPSGGLCATQTVSATVT